MILYEVFQWLDNGLQGEKLKVIYCSAVGVFTTEDKANEAIGILEKNDLKYGQDFIYSVEDRVINRFVSDDPSTGSDTIYDLNDRGCLSPSDEKNTIYICN